MPSLAIIIIAIVMLAWLAPDEDGVGGRNFARHRNELIVSSTSLVRDPVKSKYWLTGMVTNQGGYPWRVHELEVRFLDERGNLLDVRHPDVKDLFVVQPNQEHGFKVELGELSFTNNGIMRQARVQMATDGTRRLKPD